MKKIGELIQRTVRRRINGRLVPVDPPETRLIARRIQGETKDVLPKLFGTDRDRPLVASLIDGDLLELRPKGTRAAVRVRLVDVYLDALKAQANLRHLARARERKTQRAAQRHARNLRNAERRLLNS